jgi:hypothetical protein
MVYSEKKKFVFIHIPKTAGTSLREVLNRHAAGPGLANFLSRRITRMSPALGRRMFYRWRTFEPHLRYSEVQDLLPAAELAACFKFCFVRNPYERLVSFFRHIETHSNHPYHRRIACWGGFPDLVDHLAEVAEPSQRAFVLDRDGRPAMDFVGRFERIGEDFAVIADRLGIEARLPHRNANPGVRWRDFYTEDIRREVRRFYAEDFEAFGYPDAIAPD